MEPNTVVEGVPTPELVAESLRHQEPIMAAVHHEPGSNRDSQEHSREADLREEAEVREDKGDDEDEEDEEDTFETPPLTETPSTPTRASPSASVFISSTPDGISADNLSSSPQPRTPPPISPISEKDAYHISRGSMTSIALSDTSLDYENLSSEQVNDMLATPRVNSVRHRRKPSSLDILQNKWAPPERQSTLFDTTKDEPLEGPMSAIEADRDVWSGLDFGDLKPVDLQRSDTLDSAALIGAELDPDERFGSTRPTSGSSTYSDDAPVNWQKLDKTEEQEKEDKDIPVGAEDESTAFLLARLEQENAQFTSEAKSAVSKTIQRARAGSRPPSMAHLKKLVSGQEPPTIRYSLASEVPVQDEPPPMTELEFWAALVQDYLSTAVRLPTLTTSKIRAGIPPPLRGVVWTSMAGARDKHLEEAFDKLVHEKSPYEGIINKDVGRSFPGVELFRDADGEGQRMLGRVLKCFSLQDKDIGYCQGLGFLVGPLLMNMGEREAFCVLVRLMDHYSLRPSFLPSLSGLHMRIFQFSSLLKQHNSILQEHLAELGVEPAYLSQWFLSCFAVTCPLPMLFRIYDVILAEGANETVMRVALALMRRHEERILKTTEFEEVMQLLLGREIWDCYGGDADELVDDFTSLGELVTHGRLSELERDFENQPSEAVGQSAGFLPDVQAAASRFLGRLWAPGHAVTTSRTTTTHTPKASLSMLSPPSAEKDTPTGGMSLFARPGGFLRRTASRTNISLNESNGSEDSTSTTGSGSASLASTTPTEIDTSGTVRESVADSISTKSLAPQTPVFHGREQQELHGQIEDLLTALSEMQREHAQMAALLQREREDRSEDHRAMRQLISKLRKSERDDRRQTMPAQPIKRVQMGAQTKERPLSVGTQRDIVTEPEKPKDEMDELVDRVQERLTTNARFSGNLETKAQLRSTLARTREQLAAAAKQSGDLTMRLDAAEATVNAFQAESEEYRAEAQELRTRVADDFKVKQKLEYELNELRAQARSMQRKSRLIRAESVQESAPRRPGSVQDLKVRRGSVSSMPPGFVTNNGGLRELKLGRRESTSSVQSVRMRRPSVQMQPEQSAEPSAQIPDPASPEEEPPASPTVVVTMDETPRQPPAPPAAGSSLFVPRTGFARRTTSLAAKEVFATPEHEPIPDEALLLELVNSKTAEAQARQENDELRRAISMGRRRQEEVIQQLRAEMEVSRIESAKALEAAMTETAQAVEAARAAELEVEAIKIRDASPMSTPIFSLPPTPYLEDVPGQSGKSTPVTTPQEERSPVSTGPRKADTAPAAAGGWFWSRRTTSRNDIPAPL